MKVQATKEIYIYIYKSNYMKIKNKNKNRVKGNLQNVKYACKS